MGCTPGSLSLPPLICPHPPPAVPPSPALSPPATQPELLLRPTLRGEQPRGLRPIIWGGGTPIIKVGGIWGSPCPQPPPPPPVDPQHPPGHQRELFSFLIARRAAVTSPEAAVTSPEEAVLTSQGEAMTSAKEGWARVTAPVHPRPRHVPLSLCCPDGVLRRVTVTAARHGRYGLMTSRHDLIIVSAQAASRLTDRSPQAVVPPGTLQSLGGRPAVPW